MKNKDNEMIDGFKILNLRVYIPDLLENELLVFPLPVNEKDGEILNKIRIAYYKNLRFLLNNNNVKLNGSFHKYFNEGLHNYNDFSFQNLVRTINDISEKFYIDCENTYLNNLEFGVNIHLKNSPDIVLKSIINYRGTPFYPFSIKGAKGIECTTDNFYIKIYDKSNQYNVTGNILRVEIKVIKMKFFADRKININTLSSLIDINEISKLKDVLTSIFNNILFADHTINLSKLNAKDRLIIANGNNPNYWEQLKPNSVNYASGNKDKLYISDRKRYYRELKKYIGIVTKYSTSTLKNDIGEMIQEKCVELMKMDSETVDKFPDFQQVTETAKSGQIHILDIVGDCPHEQQNNVRFCKTCMRDISQKRSNAKFCSKKCKNDYTNPIFNSKNILLSKLLKYQSGLWLFEPSENIVLSEHQQKLLFNSNTIQPPAFNVNSSRQLI